MPPQAYCSFSAALHAGVDALVHLGHGLKPAQKGEGGAQEGGDLQSGTQVEKEGAHASEKEGGLNVQRQAIGLDQNGHQNGGPKHGEHMLQSQYQHFGKAQLPGVSDGFLLIHKTDSPFCFQAKKETVTKVIVSQCLSHSKRKKKSHTQGRYGVLPP